VARDYPIDRDRVTLVGHSAGATAALWLAAAQGGDGPAGVREPVKAHGVIALDGAGDLGRDQPAFDGLCGFAAVAPFMGGPKDEQAERYAAISPDGHPPHVARVLFVQAVLPSPEQKTLAALGAGGAAVEVLANLGASHFEIITPGEPTYAKNEPAMLSVLRGE
jgi:pimeloyl-ACP methyl ester carboxylesterase